MDVLGVDVGMIEGHIWIRIFLWNELNKYTIVASLQLQLYLLSYGLHAFLK